MGKEVFLSLFFHTCFVFSDIQVAITFKEMLQRKALTKSWTICYCCWITSSLIVSVDKALKEIISIVHLTAKTGSIQIIGDI